jgi:flavin-dependent dehydrogenase
LKLRTGRKYDVAIAGGGLAGLALAIQLSRGGYRVILFEKEEYPFHKVCGEYISNESRRFLEELGLNLEAMNVSNITRLQVSAVNGTLIEQNLPLGGFGISRYKLDAALANIARMNGAIIKEKIRVADILFDGSELVVSAGHQSYAAKVVCACYGKRSNLDIRWKRAFSTAKKNKLNNYVGVKYHVRTNFPNNTIALHNFPNGYCGIVKIEDDLYNVCYLTSAENLQKAGSIQAVEQTILSHNPHLKKMLAEMQMLFEAPTTISQISFDKKSQVENHVLMIGDAAGMITPLCGNGMSMALHASKIAAENINLFLQGRIGRETMERQYIRQWQKLFVRRLRTGRRIQRLFGKSWITNMFISIMKPFPGLVNYLIRRTHGKPF